MLRNGDHQTASWPDRCMDLRESALVLFDVLQNVKRADDVELLAEGNPAHIHLNQLCLGRTPCRDRQARPEQFSADDA